jgi:hypothetical protein
LPLVPFAAGAACAALFCKLVASLISLMISPEIRRYS